MKIDEINLSVIKHLRDGRKSFKAIAEDLSITENTVRSRVSKLMEERILDISGVVDPEALPGHQVVFVGVKLNSMDLKAIALRFTDLRGVISVSVVTGRYDLFLNVLLNEDLDLITFYTREIAKIPEVREVETFVAYQSYDLRVPYIL